METFEDRLRRYTFGKPGEIFSAITNNLGNWGRRELQLAKENKMLTSIFLLTHSMMMIIAEKMYCKKGLSSTEFFLKTFVDGSTVDLQFSKIAKEIHEWRNIVAHRLFSKQGHDLYFDWDLAEGWKRQNGILYLNLGKYVDQFLTIFDANSSLWTHWTQQPEKVQKQKKYQLGAFQVG